MTTKPKLFCFVLRRVYWDTQPTYCGLRGCDTVRWVDCVWNVMAHAQKPDFVFRRNGRVHLNRRGASVQSTTGSRGVRISLQGLYCSCKPVFCSHVTVTGYPLHSLVCPSLLLPCVTVCHHISTGLYTQSSRSRPSALWVCTFRPTHW